MFQDILRESWVYQEIVEEGEEKERVRRIQEQREMLLGIVQLRFPELLALAKQQVENIKDAEVLPSVSLKLVAAQSVEEARQILRSIDKSEKKH